MDIFRPSSPGIDITLSSIRGWGSLRASAPKDEFFQILNAQLCGSRQRYEELRRDEKMLAKVLLEGAEKAFAIAEQVMNRVRGAIGYAAFPYKMIG